MKVEISENDPSRSNIAWMAYIDFPKLTQAGSCNAAFRIS